MGETTVPGTDKPLYTLTIKRPPSRFLPFLMGFPEESIGAAEEIFYRGGFTGKIEEIVLESVIYHELGLTRDTALGQDYTAIGGSAAMYAGYDAFVTKKGWFGRMRLVVIAELTKKVDPLEFGRLRASPEQFVDYAISEAERVAKLNAMTVNLIMHCDQAYLRKYLSAVGSSGKK